MNKTVLMGRLTADPQVRYSQGDNATAVARYTLAVNRKFKKDGEPTADFVPCVVFGKSAEFTEKYFRKGMQVAISGRIQTGSYTNKDGNKIYTTDVVVEEQEFAESKVASQNNGSGSTPVSSDGFLDIPDGVDTQLPFN
jgi:single-strand DNA-binding protein